MDTSHYFFVGYFALWAITFFYVYQMNKKQKNLEAELKSLQSK